MRLSELFRPFLRRSLPNNTYWPSTYTRYSSRNLVYLVLTLIFAFTILNSSFKNNSGTFTAMGFVKAGSFRDRIVCHCLIWLENASIYHRVRSSNTLLRTVPSWWVVFLLHFKSSQLILSSTYIKNLFMSLCTIFLYLTLGWYYDNLLMKVK